MPKIITPYSIGPGSSKLQSWIEPMRSWTWPWAVASSPLWSSCMAQNEVSWILKASSCQSRRCSAFQKSGSETKIMCLVCLGSYWINSVLNEVVFHNIFGFHLNCLVLETQVKSASINICCGRLMKKSQISTITGSENARILRIKLAAFCNGLIRHLCFFCVYAWRGNDWSVECE